MEAPHWSDQYTADELAAALKHHAAQLAHRYGLYDIAAELRAAAECIADLSSRCERVAAKAEGLAASILDAQLAVRASIESLGKLP
jgi:hypothetical protein